MLTVLDRTGFSGQTFPVGFRLQGFTDYSYNVIGLCPILTEIKVRYTHDAASIEAGNSMEREAKSWERTIHMNLLDDIFAGERCPECGHHRLYSLSDGRLKCASCYHKYSLSMVKKDGEVLRHFSAGLSANEAAERTGFNYRTVANRYWKFRREIAEYVSEQYRRESAGWIREIFTRQNLISGMNTRSDYTPPAVLVLASRRQKLYTAVLTGLATDRLFRTLQNSAESSRIYVASPFKSYKSLQLRHWSPESESRSETSVTGQFWEYFNSKIGMYRGTSLKYFPFYLKELELRFRNDQNEFFPLAAAIHFKPVGEELIDKMALTG